LSSITWITLPLGKFSILIGSLDPSRGDFFYAIAPGNLPLGNFSSSTTWIGVPLGNSYSPGSIGSVHPVVGLIWWGIGVWCRRFWWVDWIQFNDRS
jgi:hypothetical protein